MTTTQSRRFDALAIANLTRLFDALHTALEFDDLPWLAELLERARSGRALTMPQITRISLIRATLAKQYYRNRDHPGVCHDYGGAA